MATVREDKVQIVLGITTSTAQAELQKLNRETLAATQSLKGMKKGTEEYAATQRLIAENTARMGELQKAIGLTGLTMGQLEKRSRELHRELKTMIPDSAEWKAAAGQIKEIDGRLSELRGQTKNVSNELLQMLPGFGTFDQGREALSAMTGGAKQLTSSLGVVRGAVISTGIGALVVAVTALVMWFKRTDDGARILEGTMNAIGNVLDVITGRIDALISGNFSGVFASLGEDLATAVKSGYELADAMDEIDDLKRQNALANAAEETQLERLLVKIKNKTLTEQQRLAIAEEASRIDKKLYDNKQALLEQEIKAEEEKIAKNIRSANRWNEWQKKSDKELVEALINNRKGLAAGAVSDEAKDKIVDLYLKRQELARESLVLEERIANRVDQIEKAAEEKRKARAEQREKELERLAKKREQEAAKAKAAAEKAAADELATLRKAKADEAAIISDEFERRRAQRRLQAVEEIQQVNQSKATEETKARAFTAINQRLAFDLAEINRNQAKEAELIAKQQAEKELEIAQNKVRALAEIELMEATRSGNEQAIMDAKINQLMVDRDIQLSGEQLTGEQRKAIVMRTEQEISQIRNAARESERRQIVQGFNESLQSIQAISELINANEQAEARRRLRALDLDKNRRLRMLEDEKNRGIISKEQYEAAKTKLEEESAAKSDQLRKEAGEKQRLFSIFQVLSNLAIEIARYYAEKGVIGAPFAIAAGARAAAQIATINAQEFEQGGLITLGGSRHREGGKKAGVLMTDLASNRVLGVAERGEKLAIYRRNMPAAAEYYLDLAMLAQQGVIGRQFEQGGMVAGAPPAPVVVTAGMEMKLGAIQAEIAALRQEMNEWQTSLEVQLPLGKLEEAQKKALQVRAANSY